jgi:hypothetical protein
MPWWTAAPIVVALIWAAMRLVLDLPVLAVVTVTVIASFVRSRIYCNRPCFFRQPL